MSGSCAVCLWSEDDQVRADGEPAGSDQTVQVLPTRGTEQEGGAGGRRGPLLLEPQEGPGVSVCLSVCTWCSIMHHEWTFNCAAVFSVPLWSIKTSSWSTVSTLLCISWSESQTARWVNKMLFDTAISCFITQPFKQETGQGVFVEKK